MYLEDTPIKEQKADLLNRSNFAKRLGKSIIQSCTKDGFCIGLFGPWGCGKSSIVNMVIEEIDILTSKEDDRPVVMYFNPWNFSSTDQLLQQYFIMLSNKFTDKKTNKISKVGLAIQKYAGMMDSFGDIGKVVSIGGRVLGQGLNHKSINGTVDISKQRDIIVKLLTDQRQKIIIIIDDIDRLSNDEIKLVFQLVNSVAKFPNIIYLLSFDKDIVSRALTSVQNYDGEKYLEKIIQVPIEVPEASNDFLWNALFEKLNVMIYNHPQMIFEEHHWSEVFSECVSKYIHNIRDIIRITNALSIKIEMVGNEINFADIIGITVIENYIPKIYKWIKMNKDRLTGGIKNSFDFYDKKPEDIKNKFLLEMEALEQGNSEDIMKSISILFPYFASKAKTSYVVYDDNIMRRNQRIGHKDKFDLYFGLDVDSIEITREAFDYAVFNMDKNDLQEFIIRANNNNCIITFLKELAAVTKDISGKRSKVIIPALFNTAILFKVSESLGLFSSSGFSTTEYRIRDLFLKIDSEKERYNLLKEITEKADDKCIQSLASFLNTTELAFGRLAANGVERREIEKLISLDQLILVEKIFIKRLQEITMDYELLRMENARMVLHLFESFNSDVYMEYMQKALKNDLNILCYLSFSCAKWLSGSEASWECNKDYEKFISDEIIKTALANTITDHTIIILNNDIIQGVAAYVLWREGKFAWEQRIIEKDVNNKILEWNIE